MNNLKPCPFCGGEAELCYGPGLGTDSCRGYTLYAGCNECCAKSPGLWQEKKPEPSDPIWDDVAEEWNCRPGEEELNKLWSSNLDVINRELNKQYIEARAEIERLSKRDGNARHELVYDDGDNPFAREKLEHVDFGVADNNYVLESHLLNNTLEQIKAKDKLIEQMREALEIALDCVKEIHGEESRDYTEIKAALAAERGE